MLRSMRRSLFVGFVAIAISVAAWQLLRGPTPEEILASIDVPPSPVLSAQAALRAFRVAPGFRVELVAAEPLVVDPVAMDWDDAGRLYVVEMRGFMPDIDGTGEDRPVGRVVVLEDSDADGRMDRRDVFLDGLVLPRAVAVVPEGVLVGSPPDLWLCRDTSGDRRCDEKTRLAAYAADDGNPEHKENGLVAGIDGWIYNAASSRRFRLRRDGVSLEVGETARRGQWGIAQDDAGRLYYNHNSGFLYGDAFPAEYATRHHATGTRIDKPGVYVALSEGEKVFGIRVAPGLNRAYVEGSLRADGRQAGPTAVSGLAIQRGDQYGPDFVGDAFIPEAVGHAVAHFAIERVGTELRGEHRLYPDDEWREREFLASTDERFRPVGANVGPDGAIWVIDMYRGVIQHALFVSDHLRDYVGEHGLAPPGETGRIWRIVRNDRPVERRPPPLETLAQQLAGLDHPNGWTRDRAQRRIAHAGSGDAVVALNRLDDFGALGRRHALFALEQLRALDVATWQRALRDPDPEVRKVGLRVGEVLFDRDDIVFVDLIAAMLDDGDGSVRLQALHSLGSLPPEKRPVDRLLDAGRGGDPLEVQAALSGLGGFEYEALRREIERAGRETPDEPLRAWIESLALTVHLGAQVGPDPAADVARLLDLAEGLGEDWQRLAILDGIAAAQGQPGSRRVELGEAHPLFAADRPASDATRSALARVRRHVTWPGDPIPGGARPLTPGEAARRERGRALFAQTCGTCHGSLGRGIKGLAPSLVGSPWVRDADDWLVRIALGGITGPLRIDGREWNLTMPGHGHDARFDDETLAGLLTHLRRSWGHAEDPVAPATVARIRAETESRRLPWTVAELRALDVTHRLDRYTGTYAVPVVGIEIVIGRRGSALTIGRAGGAAGVLTEMGDGAFFSQGTTIRFEADESGSINGARIATGGIDAPLSKQD
ncbi:MAG: c-type cytochrome [Myxococcales bacterium]|nr:c-type cytochrome [Myxococcales bacterium]